MKVIVLCTGRCGSLTFISACSHFENYTSGHESRSKMALSLRFDFPNNHIEADNRLCWNLGLLDRFVGKDAFYVHLIRDNRKVAASYAKRVENPRSIMRAYMLGISQTSLSRDVEIFAAEMVTTINANIQHYLSDKPSKMVVHLENIESDFIRFMEMVGAEGDQEAILSELRVHHNHS